MKNFTKKLLSAITAGVLSIGALAGCSLITTNVDRDMAQVVAVVSIADGLEEKIYKRQMVSDYNSYGYSYESYYGYTTSETYDLILTNLVENRIISQQARKALTGVTSVNLEKGYFEAAAEVADADKTSKDHVLSGVNYNGDAFIDLSAGDSLEKFLTSFEYEYARYSVLSSLNSMLSSYKDETDTEVSDRETYSVTARASLTQESSSDANEYELKNDSEKNVIDEATKKNIEKLVKDNDIEMNVSSYTNKYDLLFDFYTKYNAKFAEKLTEKENKTAFAKVIRDLRDLGFISEEEASKTTPKSSVNEILGVTYFKDAFNSAVEQQIISKYKLALQNELEKQISDEALYTEYQNLYNTQKASYDSSNTNYETALSESGKDTFVVYNPGTTAGDYNGYGYVMNLLIGFNSTQTSLLKAYSEENKRTDAEITAYREKLLGDLTAKDLRASWIYSGYGDYDAESGEFTFKDGYVKTAALNKFNGTLSGVSSYDYFDTYGNAAKGYNFKSIKSQEVSFTDFYANVLQNSEVVGFKPLTDVVNNAKLNDVDAYNFGNLNTVKTEELDDDVIEKFRDVIYAYSTDSGSLSENLGYLYSPVTSDTQYVAEFADVAKKLVKEGAGAYAVVATDYGYHVLLCSKAIKASTDMLNKTDFIASISVEGSLAYELKQYKINLVVTNEVSNKATSFIKSNKSKVTYYEDRYSDLITE